MSGRFTSRWEARQVCRETKVSRRGGHGCPGHQRRGRYGACRRPARVCDGRRRHVKRGGSQVNGSVGGGIVQRPVDVLHVRGGAGVGKVTNSPGEGTGRAEKSPAEASRSYTSGWPTPRLFGVILSRKFGEDIQISHVITYSRVFGQDLYTQAPAQAFGWAGRSSSHHFR